MYVASFFQVEKEYLASFLHKRGHPYFKGHPAQIRKKTEFSIQNTENLANVLVTKYSLDFGDIFGIFKKVNISMF